jgi:hypothetical protein
MLEEVQDLGRDNQVMLMRSGGGQSTGKYKCFPMVTCSAINLNTSGCNICGAQDS